MSAERVPHDETSGDGDRLARLQRWVQSVVAHPFGVEAGVASAAAQREILVEAKELERVILPSKQLSSAERLAIYNRAYYGRLIDCLREQFPVLAATMGEEAFAQVALAYLQAHPSRSYTLHNLGAKLADFLDESRPDGGSDSAEPVPWADLLIDLARLEWTIGEVFDGPGVEGETLLGHETLERFSAEDWASARIEMVPCLRLLTLRYPLDNYYAAIRKGGQPPLPEASESYIALVRREYIVRRYPLSRPQFTLLGSLHSGQALGEAIESAVTADLADLDDDALAGRLRGWFRTWAEAGFFRAVRTNGVR